MTRQRLQENLASFSCYAIGSQNQKLTISPCVGLNNSKLVTQALSTKALISLLICPIQGIFESSSSGGKIHLRMEPLKASDRLCKPWLPKSPLLASSTDPQLQPQNFDLNDVVGLLVTKGCSKAIGCSHVEQRGVKRPCHIGKTLMPSIRFDLVWPSRSRRQKMAARMSSMFCF